LSTVTATSLPVVGDAADVRDIDGQRRNEVVQNIIDSAKSIAGRRNVQHTLQIVNQDPPASCDLQACYTAVITCLT